MILRVTPVSYYLLIGFLLNALVVDVILPGGVKHDGIPSLASGTPEQCEEG